MSRHLVAAVCALLLCIACDHGIPVQPPPPPPAPPPINHAPIAKLVGPTTAPEGRMLMFDARGSTDPDGDRLHYTWISGDGRTLQDEFGSVGWQYGDNGTYTASVIVTNTKGAADTASLTIVVTNAPPIVTSVEPPTQQAVGAPASALVASIDSGWLDRQALTIRWGDGTSSSGPADSLFYTSDSLVHTYTAPG